MKLIGPPLPSEEEQIKALQGTRLCDGRVELLTAPSWEKDKWVALANVGGMLCVIEVSLGADLSKCKPH